VAWNCDESRLCGSASDGLLLQWSSCRAFAASLDRDFPNAAAYYLSLGTNDFGIRTQCVSPSSFADNLTHLMWGLHERNPQAMLYLQTPLHRADESQPNSCGDTLYQFRDAELRVAQTLSWVRPIDGFSPSFPQISSGSDVSPDRVHPTAQGQERYFHAGVKSLNLGTDNDSLSQGDVTHI
jgi:lysophospholipase L1-like esterase